MPLMRTFPASDPLDPGPPQGQGELFLPLISNCPKRIEPQSFCGRSHLRSTMRGLRNQLSRPGQLLICVAGSARQPERRSLLLALHGRTCQGNECLAKSNLQASRRQRGNAPRLRATDTRHRRRRRQPSSRPAPGTQVGASSAWNILEKRTASEPRESSPTNATTNATTGATRSRRCGIIAACTLTNPIMTSAATVTSSLRGGRLLHRPILCCGGSRHGFDLIRRLRS